MKRAHGKIIPKQKEEEDCPPTQRVAEEDMDEMEGHPQSMSPISEDGGFDDPTAPEGEWGAPQQPDLGWYLGQWEISAKGKIAICRTFANYLSAQLPKVVEGRPGRFSGKKIKG